MREMVAEFLHRETVRKKCFETLEQSKLEETVNKDINLDEKTDGNKTFSIKNSFDEDLIKRMMTSFDTLAHSNRSKKNFD
jgi:hypothetical protein